MTGPSSDARVLEAASYTLTVSGDPRLLATVRALSARTAETAGVTPRDAARLADAVGAVMETLAQAGALPAASEVVPSTMGGLTGNLMPGLVPGAGPGALGGGMTKGMPGLMPGLVPGLITVRFDIAADALHVVMTCDPPAGARAGWSLERELAARGRLDDLRAAAPDAEIGAEIDAEPGAGHVHHFCRLTCALSRRS